MSTPGSDKIYMRLLKFPNVCKLSSPDSTDEDFEFLELVKTGDAQELKAFLQSHPDVNVDVRDSRGQWPLELVVSQGDQESLETLLSLATFSEGHLQGALMHAILADQLDMVQALLDFLDREPSQPELAQGVVELDGHHKLLSSPRLPYESNKSALAPGMTPLMLAAIQGNLEMTYLLLSRGHTLVQPHDPHCLCLTCLKKSEHLELLSESLFRLNTYRALSSPVYIMLTSEDPVLTCFLLNHQLRGLRNQMPEHQAVYGSLAKQCSDFATDLLDQCCDTEEVQSLLNQKKGHSDPGSKKFCRLHLAVLLEQKQAHLLHDF